MTRTRKAKQALNRVREDRLPDVTEAEEAAALLNSMGTLAKGLNANIVSLTRAVEQMTAEAKARASGPLPGWVPDRSGTPVRPGDAVALADGSAAVVKEVAHFNGRGWLRVQVQDGAELVPAYEVTAQPPDVAIEETRVELVPVVGDTISLRNGEFGTVDAWSLTRTARGFPKAVRVALHRRGGMRWVMIGDVARITAQAFRASISQIDAPYDAKDASKDIRKRDDSKLGVYRG